MSIYHETKDLTKIADPNEDITSLHAKISRNGTKISDTSDFIKQIEGTVFENKFLSTINFAKKADFFSNITKLQA